MNILKIKIKPGAVILFLRKKNDNENLANCKYKDKSYFTSLDVKLKSKYLSFFHLKMNSLSKNLDNFNHDIKEPKLEFDILSISESFQFISVYFRIISFHFSHDIEQTSTESTAGEALLYINKRHSCKTRPDLAIYKSKKLESIFVHVVLPKNSNLIVGCIYKHPWIYGNVMTIILIRF